MIYGIMREGMTGAVSALGGVRVGPVQILFSIQEKMLSHLPRFRVGFLA
jgi:hypothetical protein